MIAPQDMAIPGPGARRFTLGGETMGTTWSVAFYAPADFTPSGVALAIDAVLDRTIAQMSLWAPDSDICRFNRARPGAWVSLREPFFAVLAEAVAVAGRTDGAFDPTLGALADLWGFGASGPRGTPPAQEEAAALHASTGWRRLELDAAGRRARQPGGLALDLNAIAKGDAVDRVGAALDAAGLRSWLVEIGGELRGRGLKPDGSPWWIALETGEDGACDSPAGAVAALTGMAVATSGGFRRRFVGAGRAYCHAIDPRTGAALDPDLDAVTVFAPTCAAADALATALFVMGREAGADFAQGRDIAAMFSARGGRREPVLSPSLEAMAE